MVVDPQHRYSNESERANWNIYDDFKLKKPCGLHSLYKIIHLCKDKQPTNVHGYIPVVASPGLCWSFVSARRWCRSVVPASLLWNRTLWYPRRARWVAGYAWPCPRPWYRGTSGSPSSQGSGSSVLSSFSVCKTANKLWHQLNNIIISRFIYLILYVL